MAFLAFFVCLKSAEDDTCFQGFGDGAVADRDAITSLMQSSTAVSRRSSTAVSRRAAADASVTLIIQAKSGRPINSNRKPHATSLDIVLLVLCLAVPFVLYAGTCILEQRAIEQEKAAQASDQDRFHVRREGSSAQVSDQDDDGVVRRVGSSYPMEDPSPKNVSLVPLQAIESSSRDLGMVRDGTVLRNVMAGVSTAMAALPDAISFSFITGTSPLNGIWAGVFMGLSAALVGGRPGMISSASAATAVVLAEISTDPDYGLGFMGLTVFVVGILQIIMGMFRLSRFITLVPHPVMLGFVNGLAIVMIKSQMRQYHVMDSGQWLEKDVVIGMTVTAIFAMLAALVWSRIPYANSVLPAPLASVILTAVLSSQCKSWLTRRTLRDVAGEMTFAGGTSALPSWDFPPVGVDWEDSAKLVKVLSIAVRFAIVGILESLMTQSLIDQITGTAGSGRHECFGQGVGNILSSFFGLQGGCALIAQSLMNVGSGGRTRVSGVAMALTLAACVVILAPVMSLIPVAALVGLITLIALNTFAWGSLELLLKVNFVDAVVVVVVTSVTVWKDLAVAVVTGIAVSGLGFAWTAATEVSVDNSVDTAGVRHFSVAGPLFFGSALNYRTAVCSSPFPEEVVVLEFKKSRVLDVSGLDTITKTAEHLRDTGKQVCISGLPREIVEQLQLPEGVNTDARSSDSSDFADSSGEQALRLPR